MLTLFKVDSKKKIVLDRAALKLSPELDNINQEQVLYIVLAYDYKSKFHQFPDKQRKQKACYEVYAHIDFEKVEKGVVMQRAIDKYMGLQYDPRRELMRSYMAKLDQFNDMITATTEPKEIESYLKTINTLESAISSLQSKINESDEKQTMEGGGTLSFLERLHTMEENLENYISRQSRVNVSRENALYEEVDEEA